MSNNNNNFEIKILLFIENLARILYSREGVCKAQRQEVRAAGGSVVGGWGGVAGGGAKNSQSRHQPPRVFRRNRGGGVK